MADHKDDSPLALLARSAGFTILPPAILAPCARLPEPTDWWLEQHKQCTRSQHTKERFYIECSCECHQSKKIDEKTEPINFGSKVPNKPDTQLDKLDK